MDDFMLNSIFCPPHHIASSVLTTLSILYRCTSLPLYSLIHPRPMEVILHIVLSRNMLLRCVELGQLNCLDFAAAVLWLVLALDF